MKIPGYRFVVFLVGLPVSQGIPWIGPTHTVNHPDYSTGWTPKPTDGPRVRPIVEELKRDLAVPPNTCGWVNGDPNTAWIVVNIATCFWNSNLKVVNVWSTCIDNGQSLTSCDGDCSAMVNTCPPASPYCGSIYFPSGYRGYGNCNPTPGVTHNIELTYTGLDQILDLPIFTGANGISTGTQYPLGESPAATSDLASSGASTPISSIGSKSTISTGPVASSSSSSTTSSHNSAPVGAIVGGVVGGLALICGTIIAIFWIARSKRKDPGPATAPAPMFQALPGNKGHYQPHTYELEQPQHVSELEQTHRRSELQQSPPPLYGAQNSTQGYPLKAELHA